MSDTRERALVEVYWRLRSYAIHDNDCKLNKPPKFEGPCSCGLSKALKDGEIAAKGDA